MLKEEVKKLRRKLRELQQKDTTTTPPPATTATTSVSILEKPGEVPEEDAEVVPSQVSDKYAGHTENELYEAIAHIDNLYCCVLKVLTMLFSREYIVSHSVTGQRANSTTVAKPKFDDRLYSSTI